MTTASHRIGIASLAATVVALAGCDSFLDPSVTGRWERTPMTVPILTHLAVIEDATPALVEISEIQPQDLIPESDPYIIGPGDFLTLTIYGLIVSRVPEILPRPVDQNGYIEIPQLGRIFVAGLTEDEVVQLVKERAAIVIADPDVSVVLDSRRQQSFHLMGAVPEPGAYLIPASDYKILQALLAGGGFQESVNEVFVIRQVPLTAEAAGVVPERPEDRRGADPDADQDPVEDGENLLDIIDDLADPAPSVLEGAGYTTQPAQPDPLIDLINADAAQADERSAQAQQSGPDTTRWVFREGGWIRVERAAPVRVPAPEGVRDPLAEAAGLVTQRVIRVPVGPLIQGDARYNIIVRPGDVIRVPPSPRGIVYVGGEVTRPGSFNLPEIGRLTLSRVITSAGGLTTIAIPRRVDLTRVVGPDEQATVMLDLRAIREGSQPDLYLKPDDHINVGTNFWATPLAIVRNGFRASYGFGFLLDRNFGNDVFGAPPDRRGF